MEIVILTEMEIYAFLKGSYEPRDMTNNQKVLPTKSKHKKSDIATIYVLTCLSLPISLMIWLSLEYAFRLSKLALVLIGVGTAIFALKRYRQMSEIDVFVTVMIQIVLLSAVVFGHSLVKGYLSHIWLLCLGIAGLSGLLLYGIVRSFKTRISWFS